MTDIAYCSHSTTTPGKTMLTVIIATAKTTVEVMREWRHRYRSRQELALYSYHERNDLRFAADVDAEIAKPFWSK